MGTLCTIRLVSPSLSLRSLSPFFHPLRPDVRTRKMMRSVSGAPAASPMWRQRGMPAPAAVAQTGSQTSSCAGLATSQTGNSTALAPSFARRWSSDWQNSGKAVAGGVWVRPSGGATRCERPQSASSASRRPPRLCRAIRRVKESPRGVRSGSAATGIRAPSTRQARRRGSPPPGENPPVYLRKHKPRNRERSLKRRGGG